MTTFQPGDTVEVQVQVNNQTVWAEGEVLTEFGGDYLVRWTWNGWRGTMTFASSRIREIPPGRLAEIEAERQALVELKAKLKPDDDVEIQININNETVWIPGRFISLSGDAFAVAYAYGNRRGTTYVRYPNIRFPSPELLARLTAVRDLEAALHPGDSVEVLINLDGEEAWVPGIFTEAANGQFIVRWKTGSRYGTGSFDFDHIRRPPAAAEPEYTRLSPDIEYVVLHNGPVQVERYRYQVDGQPFDTVRDFAEGPATHANVYGCTRQFFLTRLSTGRIGIIWQDKDDASIQLTGIATGLQSAETLALPNDQGEDLVAAAFDGQDNCYYCTVQPGQGSETAPLSATLYKVGPTGELLGRQDLDTSAAALDIRRFRDVNQNTADMQFLDGHLGLIIGRDMYSGHQGAIALVFDAETLNLLKNHGQTSGHSFGNRLMENPTDAFTGLDLGDNYPRGINLHRFTANDLRSRVVYTFKTQHGDTPLNPMGDGPYPVYSEISTDEQTCYRWSNDNRTYSELGGIIPFKDHDGRDSYTVIFIGEPDPEGKALRNDRSDDYLNDARNLGLVQVRADFQEVAEWSKRCVVTDEVVFSSGITETAGFYGFNGNWFDQQNTGVVWLTDYQEKEETNASRLRAAKLGSLNDERILLLWETWTPYSYRNTFALKISAAGEKEDEPVAIGPHVRLNRQDDVLVVDDAVYVVSGDGREKRLVLDVIRVG